uniref:Protein POLR1D isoform X3 n=1 Tax=Petromyzon marinus TaxID=7757 RepID=A0AAJ7T965_PETMA|nr:protein POLR1D isoform X3 [Petromyzon marinus]
MDEAELERLAREEILQEANRGRVRAETMGTMGWQKCPLPATNKRFLVNTLRGALMPPRSRVASSSRDHASREDTSSPPSKSPVQGHKEESHDDGAREKHLKEKTRRRPLQMVQVAWPHV